MDKLDNSHSIDKNKKIALILAPYYTYLDVLNNWLDLFEKYGKNVPYEIFVSSSKTIDRKNINFVLSKKEDKMPKRILNIVEKYDFEYYLIINEDVFINDYISEESLSIITDFLEYYDVDYLKLLPIKNNYRYNIYKNILYRSIKKNEYYGVSTMTCLVSKNYLLKKLFIDENESIWEVEGRFFNNVNPKDDTRLEGCFAIGTNIFNLVHCLSKGKWIRKGIRLVKKNNPEFNFNNREKLSMIKTFSIWLRSIFIRMIPNKKRVKVKKILSILGVKFVIK